MCCFVRITCLRGHWVWPCGPHTLVSLTITALSLRVSFLSPGVSQHDSCSLQEQSHAKSPAALFIFLYLSVSNRVSRHIQTLNLSFTKLETNFSMWFGVQPYSATFLDVFRLRPPTHWRNWQNVWQIAMHKWFCVRENSRVNLQSSRSLNWI